MADLENLSVFSRSERARGAVAVVIPARLFIALKQLHKKSPFQSFVIGWQRPEEEAAALEKLSRAHSLVIRRIHGEMIELTLVALAFLLLCFLLTRTGAQKWTTYLLITAVAACLAACWLQW